MPALHIQMLGPRRARSLVSLLVACGAAFTSLGSPSTALAEQGQEGYYARFLSAQAAAAALADAQVADYETLLAMPASGDHRATILMDLAETLREASSEARLAAGACEVGGLGSGGAAGAAPEHQAARWRSRAQQTGAEAAAAYRRVLQDSPPDEVRDRAEEGLGTLLVEMGSKAEGLAVLGALAKRRPDSPASHRAWMRIGEDALSQGRLAEAEAMLRRAAGSSTRSLSWNARMLAAECRLLLGDPASALRELDALLGAIEETAPSDPIRGPVELRYLRAMCRQHRARAAERILAARWGGDDRRRMLWRLGKEYFQEGLLDDALVLGTSLLARENDPARQVLLLWRQVECLAKLGRRAEALRRAAQALSTARRVPEPSTGAGIGVTREDRRSPGRVQALGLQRARDLLLDLYEDLRRAREAAAAPRPPSVSPGEAEAGVALARLLARQPPGLDAELRFALGRLLDHAGKREEASREYLAVLNDPAASEELRRAAGQDAVEVLRATLPRPTPPPPSGAQRSSEPPSLPPQAAAFVSACNAYLKAFPAGDKAGPIQLDKAGALARYGQAELAIRVYEGLVAARGAEATAAAEEVIRLRAAAGDWAGVGVTAHRYLAAGLGDEAFRSALLKTAEEAEVESMDAAAARDDPSAPVMYRAFALRRMSSPLASQAMLRAAALFRRSGRRPEATQAYGDVVSRWPKVKKASEAWLGLAGMADEVGALEEAARAYEGHARSTGPRGTKPDLLLRAALYRDALGHRPAALEDALLVLERSPNRARGCDLLLRLSVTARQAHDLVMAKRSVAAFLARCRGAGQGTRGRGEADGATAARIYQGMVLLQEDPAKGEPLLRAQIDRVLSRKVAGPRTATAFAAAAGLVASRALGEARGLRSKGRQMTNADRTRMAVLLGELEILAEAVAVRWAAMAGADGRALAEGLDGAMQVLVNLSTACVMAAQAIVLASLSDDLDTGVAQAARARFGLEAERYLERSRWVAEQAVGKAAGSGYVGTWLRRAVALSFRGKGGSLVKALTLAAPARLVLPTGDGLAEAARLEPLPAARAGEEGGR